VFEELIRKFAELSNETAGEHFTPREVIKLMVNLIFIEDDEALTQPGIVRSLYDPTAGTGGMLSVAEEHLVSHNPSARLVLSGQELNAESYAICKADMLIKGQDINSICFGNTLSDDQLPEEKYDYMLSNPPFGVEWKKIQKEVQREAELMGYSGRFGPGLPRVSDGSLLFLLHLISKMRPAQDGGCRFGIVLNGSPLFTGGAGSGESEIRRYVLENDLLEAIIALPTDMFYNTDIETFIWILSNRKPEDRKGKVQLIDGSNFWQKMRKSLGSKRKELAAEHIEEITKLFGDFEEVEKDGKPISKVFKNEDFGYQTITVERPLRDEEGNVVLGQRGKAKGKPQADSSLRDTENVPLSEDVETYFEREVLPHVPDAWIDHAKTKKGYEIPFNRHFFAFIPPRQLEEIDAELKQVTECVREMIDGAVGACIPKYSRYEPLRLKGINEKPEHWHDLRLRFAATFNPSKQEIKGLAQSTLVSFLPMEAIGENGETRLDQEKEISECMSGYTYFRDGDVCIAKITPCFENGKGAVWRGLKGGIGFGTTELIVARPHEEKVTSTFLDYLYRSQVFRGFGKSEMYGAGGQKRVPESFVKNFVGLIPPIEEQKQATIFLDQETAKIDALIAEQQRLIGLLRERRSTLISDVVTGQIDVRGRVTEVEP
jgi:type I restriction-modification system DNA methylase subunit